MIIKKKTKKQISKLTDKTKIYKNEYMNINTYRNLQHFDEAKSKKLFRDMMEPQLSGLKFEGPIQFVFTVYTKTTGWDLDNKVIIQKYLQDAMMHWGCIEEDNVEYLNKYSRRFGGISNVPRVELSIMKGYTISTEMDRCPREYKKILDEIESKNKELID